MEDPHWCQGLLGGLTGSGCSVRVTQIQGPLPYYSGVGGRALRGSHWRGGGGRRLQPRWGSHSRRPSLQDEASSLPSGPHLRSVDSGARAASGASISSAAQQTSFRASCANSMTAPRRRLPRPLQERRPPLTSRARRGRRITFRAEPGSRLCWVSGCLASLAPPRWIPSNEDGRGVGKRRGPLAFCVLPLTTSCSLKGKRSLMPHLIFLTKWDFHPRRMRAGQGDAKLTAL